MDYLCIHLVYFIIYSCQTYLANESRLLIPEQLSENTITAILQCLVDLLCTLDKSTISSFLSMLSTPIDDDNIDDHSIWYTKQFLPIISTSEGKKYIESVPSLLKIGILFKDLHSLLSHSSHTILSLALSAFEVLFLVCPNDYLIPFYPSFLSTLAISLRTDSLMTWREKELTILLIAQALHSIPCKPVEKEQEQPSLQSMIASWFDKLQQSSEGSEGNEINEESSIPDEDFQNIDFTHNPLAVFESQTKRVINELPSKIPSLLTIVFESLSTDLHTNLRLIILHSCYLLLQPCIQFFPSSFLLLVDQLVSELNSSYQLLANLSQLLLSSITDLLQTYPQMKDLLYNHINQLFYQLVPWIKHSSDYSNLQAISKLMNYCCICKEDLPIILSLNGNLVEEVFTLYTNLKECLKVQQVTNLSIQILSHESNHHYYSIQYQYCNEATSFLLYSFIQSLGEALSSIENEAILWFLSDCMKEDGYEACLIANSYLSYHHALSPLLREFISTLLDSIQYSSSQLSSHSQSIAFILMLITNLLIQTNAVNEFKPSLLSNLFTYRSILDQHGMILYSLHQITLYYHYQSISELVLNNYDYLFDSLFIKIHFALSIDNSILIKQYILILTSLWNDLIVNKPKSELLPFLKDSIEISKDLLHKQQDIAIDLLVPITSFLVASCQDLPSQSIHQDQVSVDSFLDAYFEKKIIPFQSLLQSSSYIFSSDTVSVKKENQEVNETGNISDLSNTPDLTETTEESEREEITMLKSIIHSIKFIIPKTSSIQLLQSIIQILLTVMKLPWCEEQFSLLNEVRPFFYTLLENPNYRYYKDAISVYLRYIALDNQATISYLQDDCWPSIQNTLIGCIQAQEDDFSIIHNREYALDLEKSLIDILCSVYTNSFIFESIAYDLCEIIDQRARLTLPSYYLDLLKLLCYYNNDAIEQFLFNNGMDQFSQSPSLQCIRFQQLPTKTKTTIHSNFIKALDTCKLLIQYDCLFFLFYHLYFLLFSLLK